VAFLGVDTLKSLALVHGIFAQIRAFPQGFNGDHLWHHSLQLAAASREIAKMEGLGRELEADCFTGGLLHDVGLLLLATGFPSEYHRITGLLASDSMEILDAEMEVLGVHHGEVGAHILGLWGLPGAVVEAVAHHHCPRPSSGITPDLVVHAAETLSTAHGDCKVFGLHRDADTAALAEVLGPRLEAWRLILERVREG